MSLYGQAADAAEAILRDVYGLQIVAKALDPTDPNDFLVISSRLASSLSSAAEDGYGDALRRAIDGLDVDWPALSEAARDEVVRASRDALKAAIPKGVLPAISEELKASGTRIVRGSKQAVSSRYQFDIELELTKVDQQIVRHAAESQGLYVRDALGNRIDSFGEKARDIVSSGLEQGLGREVIAGDLAEALTGAARADSYWKLIAGTFANRSRTYGQLRSYEDAAVDTYIFFSVMDSKTSEICRFMHGRRFSVKRALNRYALSAAKGPEGVVDVMPWVSSGTDGDGNDVLYFNRGEDRVTVAQVDDSGEGVVDEQGSYSKQLSDEELEAAGVTVPPLHGHCRSTIVME